MCCCFYLGGSGLVRTKHCQCGAILQSARRNLEPLSIAHFLQSFFTCGPWQHQCLVLEFCKVDHDVEQSMFSRFCGFWTVLWQQGQRTAACWGLGAGAVKDLPHVPPVKKESNPLHLQNRKIFPVLLVANCEWLANRACSLTPNTEKLFTFHTQSHVLPHLVTTQIFHFVPKNFFPHPSRYQTPSWHPRPWYYFSIKVQDNI